MKIKPQARSGSFGVVASSLPRQVAASRINRDKFRGLYVKLTHYRQACEREASKNPPESGYVDETPGGYRARAGISMSCAENQAIEIKAVVQPGQRPGQREKKMLKMKVDPEISMKTKDGENLQQVDPDILMKTS